MRHRFLLLWLEAAQIGQASSPMSTLPVTATETEEDTGEPSSHSLWTLLRQQEAHNPIRNTHEEFDVIMGGL